MNKENALKLLLDAYVELLRLHTEPGEKSHMLAHHTEFIQRQINLLLKEARIP